MIWFKKKDGAKIIIIINAHLFYKKILQLFLQFFKKPSFIFCIVYGYVCNYFAWFSFTFSKNQTQNKRKNWAWHFTAAQRFIYFHHLLCFLNSSLNLSRASEPIIFLNGDKKTDAGSGLLNLGLISQPHLIKKASSGFIRSQSTKRFWKHKLKATALKKEKECPILSCENDILFAFFLINFYQHFIKFFHKPFCIFRTHKHNKVKAWCFIFWFCWHTWFFHN